jgi:hypothetical protein
MCVPRLSFQEIGTPVMLPKPSIISCVSDIQGKLLLFVVVTETCGIGKRKIKRGAEKWIYVKTEKTSSGKLDYNV